MNRKLAMAPLTLAVLVAAVPAIADDAPAKDVQPNAGRASYQAPAIPTSQSGPMAFDPEQRLARLTQRLKLTPEQQASMKPILEDVAAQVKAARGSAKNPRNQKENDAARAKVGRILKDSNAQIEALLTDEQKEEWGKLKTEASNQGKLGLQADVDKDKKKPY